MNGNLVGRNQTGGYDKQVDLQMGRDDMKVRYDDDYYKGQVEMGGQQWGYEFKRAGATTAVVGGAMALATATINLM